MTASDTMDRRQSHLIYLSLTIIVQAVLQEELPGRSNYPIVGIQPGILIRGGKQLGIQKSNSHIRSVDNSTAIACEICNAEGGAYAEKNQSSNCLHAGMACNNLAYTNI